jgi:hypothetical protein
MIIRTEVSFVVGLILFACAVSVCGQSVDPSRKPPVLRSTDTTPENQVQSQTPTSRQTGPATLVTVPAIVMDRDGRYIGNLRKEDFRLYENGVERT